MPAPDRQVPQYTMPPLSSTFTAGPGLFVTARRAHERSGPGLDDQPVRVAAGLDLGQALG